MQNVVPTLIQNYLNKNIIGTTGVGALPLFGLSKSDVERMEASRDMEGLVEALEYTEDSLVRGAAARALGKIGSEDAVNGLIVALKDLNNDVRKDAVSALGSIRNEDAINALVVVLKDSDASVRKASADVLVQIGSSLSTDGLKRGLALDGLAAALTDQNSDVRVNAAQALGEIGDARAVDELVIELTNNDSQVRIDAAKALWKIGDSRAADGLAIALKDQDNAVRYYAAEALGKFGDARAIYNNCSICNRRFLGEGYSCASCGVENLCDQCIESARYSNKITCSKCALESSEGYRLPADKDY